MPRITNMHKDLWFIALAVPVIVWVLAKYGKRGRTLVFCVLLALGLADFTSSHILKNAIWRDRPCRRLASTGGMSLSDTRLLPGRGHPAGYVATPENDCPGSSSLPSSHAANTMALAMVLWWFTRRRTRWLWFLIPLVIGWSRIYLGYHYPADVLWGWLTGALLALGIVRWLAVPFTRELVKEEQKAADEGTLVTGEETHA